jgi:hypothetical protein
MPELKEGSVTLVLPTNIEVIPEAGKLTAKEMTRNPDKARRGVGLAAKRTAVALRKDPERFKAIAGVVTPEQLEDFGRQADEMDDYIVDLENLLVICKQNNFLLDSRAHRSLRRVLSFVRGEEKFDPRIAEAFPELVEYFSNTQGLPEDPNK